MSLTLLRNKNIYFTRTTKNQRKEMRYMSYEIMTDSPANLPNAIIEQYNIHVVAMKFMYDNKPHVCLDIDNFDDHAYYDIIRSGKRITTSQITPYEFIEFMEPVLKEGKDILFVSVSSGISGSCASSLSARQELLEKYPDRKITVIDSLAASFGEGMIVIKSAELREKGLSLEEVEKEVIAYRDRLYQVFFVDDLMHLSRTGRINMVGAIVGSIFRFKPLLKGSAEGKIVPFGKYRGKKAILQAIYEKFAALCKNFDFIGVSYAEVKEDAEYLVALLKEKFPIKKAIIVKHEPATASHIGPGGLALFFEGAPGVRDL